jgi:hypothetical protein
MRHETLSAIEILPESCKIEEYKANKRRIPRMESPKIDEIGPWSEVKLDIVKRYAVAYSQILNNHKGLSHSYIDAFAGAGSHVSKTTREMVPGSPLNALWVAPPFRDFCCSNVILSP